MYNEIGVYLHRSYLISLFIPNAWIQDLKLMRMQPEWRIDIGHAY